MREIVQVVKRPRLCKFWTIRSDNKKDVVMSILCLVWAFLILLNRKTPHPLKNCAIATLQPHNSSPRLSGQGNIHISSSKSKIISFRVPGANNYNYFLNSLPQLNGELASRLTKSIFTITMMKWILILCNLCKTSYNVLIHSHVIVLELKFWGEFRFPGISISVNVDFWNGQFYSKEQTSIRQLSET